MKNIFCISLALSIFALILDEALSDASENACPSTSEKWRDLGGNFCYIVEKNDKVTWIDAVYNCFRQGGTLASFHSFDEMERIVRYGNEETIGLYIGLWKHYDGSLVWVDKSPLDFRNWNPGEPNFPNEKCVEFFVDSGKWNDIDCNAEMGYICAYQKSLPGTRNVPILKRKVCPDISLLWNDLGGDSCYIIETGDLETWQTALKKCQNNGGSLASFHSIEEISVVLQNTKSLSTGFHIGLRQYYEGGFRWFDGSPMDLDYWMSGVPKRSQQGCGAMNSQTGQWYNIKCEEEAPFICSVPKGPCGRYIRQDSGIIFSPGFPGTYGANEDCTWNITVSKGHKIALQFERLHLEFSENCFADYVKIFDGHATTSPELGTFCGQSSGIIRSSGDKVAIRFVTDSTVERQGFLIKFTKVTVCDQNLSVENGVIESPNFPNTYSPGERCVWKIAVPVDFKISLEFLNFEIEYHEDCVKDFVEIRDGLEETSPLLGRFCGSHAPNSIVSTANEMSVIFESDFSSEEGGFYANFRNDTCGRNIESNNGVIHSPNYGTYYRKNEYCTWKITVQDNYTVALDFLMFDLEHDPNCSKDYVEIRDGHSIFSPLLGKFCGDTPPEIIRSSTNKISVAFVSDMLEERRGFSAKFMKGETCGANLISETGEIHNPSYPKQYGPAEMCIWNITVPVNSRVSLRFSAFDVEASPGCKADFVQILDGHDRTSPVLGRFCGDSVPENPVKSSGNTMAVVFASDLSVQKNGFFATFENVLCGKDITAGRGKIASPNFPANYRRNENCVWRITVPEGYLVALQFEVFELENACIYDYVEVRDGHEPDSAALGKYCGDLLPGILRSSSNKLSVIFKTDNGVQKKGFSAKFTKEVSPFMRVENLIGEPCVAVKDAVRKTKEKFKSETLASGKSNGGNP